VVVVDTSVDDFLRIKFTVIQDPSKECYNYVRVYLPPEHSARAVNVNEFLDSLMTKIYTIRCAEIPDYVEGIDDLPDRLVIDFGHNTYGRLLCDFLINGCILNGRSYTQNNFTFISSRGSSVVDYCLVQYEQLHYFTNFKVNTANDVVNSCCKVGDLDLRTIIPDHSLIYWEVNLSHLNIVRAVQ